MKKFTVLSLISAGLIAGNVRADSMNVAAEAPASASVISTGAGKVIPDFGPGDTVSSSATFFPANGVKSRASVS